VWGVGVWERGERGGERGHLQQLLCDLEVAVGVERLARVRVRG
jgi:hypothetical protein